MTSRIHIRILAAAGGMALLLAGSGAALAQGHGGAHFGGGGHAAGGHVGYAGAVHGGGYRGGLGYGGYRGWHGGYGYGGYGWRGGYYGGWGWGGLGLGLAFASLPLYYSTLWWGGVPYYYADDTYYRYDSGIRRYVTVAPPPEIAARNTAQPTGADLIAYPKNGQSTELQAKDRYECHHWAATQTGFDPTLGAATAAGKRDDYLRAQAACLDGRGYSVR